MMRFAFRVDASVHIGTGHVIRCLTLADRLAARGAACDFVMRAHPGNLIEQVRDRGYEVFELPDGTGAPSDADGTAHAAWLGTDRSTDAAQTRDALTGQPPYDWLVIDHYAIDARWQAQLGQVARRVFVIDDLADRAHDCDLLLDQNLQAAPGRYASLLPGTAQTLLGPRYALLRPEFEAHRATLQRDAGGAVARILVFLGGIDAPGLTLPVLQMIEKLRGPDVQAEVVVGAANPRREIIADWCASRSWTILHDGNADMGSLTAACDLAIGAGGTTMWERAALAIPSVVVAIAENQKPGSEAVAAEGAALYVGDEGSVENGALEAALRVVLTNPWLREQLSKRSALLVDGRGAARVADRLLDGGLSLRRAVAADCDLVWTWRNDERTRRHFHDPRPVDLAAHRRWFAASLEMESRDLLLGSEGEDPVGVLRFDHEGDRALVSVYLVPDRAGRGEGAWLLRAGLRWLADHRPAIRDVDAEVLAANEASRRAFEAAGFARYASTYRHRLAESVR